MTPDTQGTRVARRFLGLRLPGWRSAWVTLAALTVIVGLFPISLGVTRLFLAVAVPVLAIGAVALVWRWRHARVPALAVVGLPLLFLVLPGREGDALQLRTRYLASLRAFEGTRYVWGGEGRLGIDCSGLVRRALVNAAAQESVLRLNPGLARLALDVWWHDASARELMAGYGGRTQAVGEGASINALAPEAAHPGDLAVTRDGIHVMASLGNGEWAEADPGALRVLCLRTPVRDNYWFEKPVKLCRWTVLADAATQ